MGELPTKYQNASKVELRKASRARPTAEHAAAGAPANGSEDVVAAIAAIPIPDEELTPDQVKTIAKTMFPS